MNKKTIILVDKQPTFDTWQYEYVAFLNPKLSKRFHWVEISPDGIFAKFKYTGKETWLNEDDIKFFEVPTYDKLAH